MPSGRPIAISLAVGLLHAAALLLIALDLGYTVGPSAYAPIGSLWRYAGLVVVAALPVWLALRYRLVSPFVALVLTTGYVLGMELSPPEPTFRDVAELEHLAEPTGITVVENGLYIIRYMLNASVWAVGFLFLGLVEFGVRTRWDRLSPVRAAPPWLSIQTTRRRAALVGAAGGLLHAAVMVWFALRLGVPVSGWLDRLMFLYGAAGMWVLAAVPIYLLLRHRLLAPMTMLTAFVLLDVQAAFRASVDDPHALYFWGWFVYLGVLLVAGGVEYGIRRLGGDRAGGRAQ